MKTTAEKFCVVCFALSAFLPWALMVTAAALALFGTGTAVEKTSAYLACAGLVVLLLSYLMARLANLIAGH
ncbi:MAG: hypothetical protein N4A39_00275 [Roseicyclus sp.]|jgi:hypothetical protein|nr:hypothetical protein [Roseicyclus sp.]